MKKLLALILAASMLFTLVACESAKPAEAAPVATEAPKATVEPTKEPAPAETEAPQATEEPAPAAPESFLWDNFDDRDPNNKPELAPNGANLWWDNWANLRAKNEDGAIKLDMRPKAFDPEDYENQVDYFAHAADWMANWGEAVNMWALENISWCKYLVIRVKGAEGGEETKLIMDWHPEDAKFYAARFSDLVLKDGSHPVITTEWQNLVIDLEASGFPGMTNAFHIRAFDKCVIWLDEITFSEPIAPIDATSQETILSGMTVPETGKPGDLPIAEYLGVDLSTVEAPAEPEATAEPEAPVAEPETPSAAEVAFLWDNFDDRDPNNKPELAPNGANLWWDNWANLRAKNEDGAIKLDMRPKAFDPEDYENQVDYFAHAADWMANWGEAVNMWALENISWCKYLVIRVKGAEGGEETKLIMDWHPEDAKFYAARFSDLVLKDGSHPVITTEWQNLVIDLEASGFPGMTNAFHIRAFDKCVIWLDEIYFAEPIAPIDTTDSAAIQAGMTVPETGKPGDLPIAEYLGVDLTAVEAPAEPEAPAAEPEAPAAEPEAPAAEPEAPAAEPEAPAAEAAVPEAAFLWDNFDDRDPNNKPELAPNGANLWWDNWANLRAKNEDGAIKLDMRPKAFDKEDYESEADYFAHAADWMANWGEAVNMWALENISWCKYLVIRVKGAEGGEEAKLIMDWHPEDAKFFAARFSDLVLKDGSHPVITTEWQDLVIDLEASGFPGMTNAFHIRAFDKCVIWLDEIYFAEPIAPIDTTDSAAIQAGMTVPETGKPGDLPIAEYLGVDLTAVEAPAEPEAPAAEPEAPAAEPEAPAAEPEAPAAEPEAPAAEAAVPEAAFLWDNFDDRDPNNKPELAPNGANLWWDNWANLRAKNEDGAIKLDMRPKAFDKEDYESEADYFAHAADWMANWGEAVNMWALENISWCKYLVIRVKGAEGGEEAKLIMDWHPEDAKFYAARFSDLVLADGSHPVITTEWQDLVIDLEASGFPGMTNAFHIRAFDKCVIWLDEIYFAEPIAPIDTTDSAAIQAGMTVPETGKPGDLPIQTYLEALSGAQG